MVVTVLFGMLVYIYGVSILQIFYFIIYFFVHIVQQSLDIKVKHPQYLQHFYFLPLFTRSKEELTSLPGSRVSRAAKQLNVATQIKRQLSLLIRRHRFRPGMAPTILTVADLSFRLIDL